MENKKIDQLTSLFFKTSRLIRKYIKPTKKTDPSNFLRMNTLRYISKSEQPTMQDVAKFLSITPPSATSLINKLAQSKMISRNSDASDRRIIRLKITPRGIKILKKVHSDMMKHMKEVFGELDEKDANDFIRIMQRLHKTYKE